MTPDELTDLEQRVVAQPALYARSLCREVRRLTAENDELRQRPTLEQVVRALDDTYWEESCDVRRAIERTIQVLYAAETPHD